MDPALFGAPHGMQCVTDVFGRDRVLVGTDAPFDTHGGSHFIPTIISDVERAVPEQSARDAIFQANAHGVLGLGAARNTSRAPPHPQ